jgi:hypothetical protein
VICPNTNGRKAPGEHTQLILVYILGARVAQFLQGPATGWMDFSVLKPDMKP